MPPLGFIQRFSTSRLGQCLLFVVGCSSFANAADPGPCSNETLRGDYAFTITGQILAPSPAAGTVAGVTWTHFDGHREQDDQMGFTNASARRAYRWQMDLAWAGNSKMPVGTIVA